MHRGQGLYTTTGPVNDVTSCTACTNMSGILMHIYRFWPVISSNYYKTSHGMSEISFLLPKWVALSGCVKAQVIACLEK